MTTDFLNGKTEWGTAKMLGVKDGFVDFVQDDPIYLTTVLPCPVLTVAS